LDVLLDGLDVPRSLLVLLLPVVMVLVFRDRPPHVLVRSFNVVEILLQLYLLVMQHLFCVGLHEQLSFKVLHLFESDLFVSLVFLRYFFIFLLLDVYFIVSLFVCGLLLLDISLHDLQTFLQHILLVVELVFQS